MTGDDWFVVIAYAVGVMITIGICLVIAWSLHL